MGHRAFAGLHQPRMLQVFERQRLGTFQSRFQLWVAGARNQHGFNGVRHRLVIADFVIDVTLVNFLTVQKFSDKCLPCGAITPYLFSKGITSITLIGLLQTSRGRYVGVVSQLQEIKDFLGRSTDFTNF